jgi:hypothetical protein
MSVRVLTDAQRSRINAQRRERWEVNPRTAEQQHEAYLRRRIRDPDYGYRWHLSRKAILVARYGGSCACCGETALPFLSIDHENGDGNLERQVIGQKGVMKKLLASEVRLEGYRILCMNCQFGTRFGRTCPHQVV